VAAAAGHGRHALHVTRRNTLGHPLVVRGLHDRPPPAGGAPPVVDSVVVAPGGNGEVHFTQRTPATFVFPRCPVSGAEHPWFLCEEAPHGRHPAQCGEIETPHATEATMNKFSSLLLAVLAPTLLAACADAPDTVLSTDLPRAAVTAQNCTSLLGTAVEVKDDFKVLRARLQGDLTGTLQIVEHTHWQVGVVERSTAAFTVEVEPGRTIFGDGIAGRVPPSGGTVESVYRYVANGKLDGGTDAYSQVTGLWEIDGWIKAGSTDTSLDYRMVLCTR
jgi:hypothetical protein